ncbi:MAG TPA: DUF2155 domain-containing protein [Alphaproteobacteria bacterium]|nr:DUF2155 domain-containing protein [Alphaproteobacteria bacterium]
MTNCKLLITYSYLLMVFCAAPTYGQSIDELVNELAGSEADLIESEREEIIKKKEDHPSPPSSTEIMASQEKDEFAPEENIVTNGVTLQGLDKQTARVFIIDARIGQTIEFGNLKIIVRHCEKAPLADRQESMAFVSISEEKPNSHPENLFAGWMFASSPALSALDHPIYDVWVKECKEIK